MKTNQNTHINQKSLICQYQNVQNVLVGHFTLMTLRAKGKGGAGGARAPPVFERNTIEFTQNFTFEDAFCTSCTPCF